MGRRTGPAKGNANTCDCGSGNSGICLPKHEASGFSNNQQSLPTGTSFAESNWVGTTALPVILAKQ